MCRVTRAFDLRIWKRPLRGAALQGHGRLHAATLGLALPLPLTHVHQLSCLVLLGVLRILLLLVRCHALLLLVMQLPLLLQLFVLLLLLLLLRVLLRVLLLLR